MKRMAIAAATALLFAAATCEAQVFDAGYTFTYYFPTLPSYFSTGYIPETGLFTNPAYTPLTATIRWEIFHSLPNGVPLHSGIWHPGDLGWALFLDTWLDGEGSFRITVLSGSQLIQSYYVYIPESLPTGGVRIWSDVIPAPVPEPATPVLISLGLALIAFVVRRAHII